MILHLANFWQLILQSHQIFIIADIAQSQFLYPIVCLIALSFYTRVLFFYIVKSRLQNTTMISLTLQLTFNSKVLIAYLVHLLQHLVDQLILKLDLALFVFIELNLTLDKLVGKVDLLLRWLFSI